MNRFEGRLTAICIAPAKAAPMQRVEEVDAVAGQGLAGDRYANAGGTFEGGQITLIEQEALVAAEAGYELAFTHEQSRRNLLTEGVPLNHLVGRCFRVGPVVIRGLELCEPCGHMERLSEVPGSRKALIHRGGLRAEIVSGGTLRAGDAIVPCDEP